MPNPNQIKIGYIKSFAKKGDRITVYFPNGKSDRFVANNDITSTQVMVIGDRAFSQDAAQQKLHITTRLFKSRNNYDDPQKYPFLSVFINSSNKLVATYNGGQRVIGDMPFSEFNAVNLNHKGNGVFTGVALSSDRSKFIKFSNEGINNTVKNFDPLKNFAKISGYVAWDAKDKTPELRVDPPTPNSVVSFIGNAGLNTSYYDPTYLTVGSINHDGNGAYDPSYRTVQFIHVSRYGGYGQDWIENAFSFIYFWQNPNYNYNTASKLPQSIASNPFTVSYKDSKPIKNVNRQLETIGLNTVTIDYDFANGGRVFSMPELSQYHISDLSYITNEQVNHTWQWQHTEDLEASDNQVRTASFSAYSAYNYSQIINFDNTLEAFGTNFNRNFHAWGEVAGSKEVELVKSFLDQIPIVVSDHKTINQIESFDLSETNTESLSCSYDRETGYGGQFNPPGDNDDIYIPLDSDTLVTASNSSSLQYIVTSNFNAGDLGIYLEKKKQTATQYDCNSNKTTAFVGIAQFVNVTGIGSGKYLTFGQRIFSLGDRSALTETETITYLDDSELYKIAYLDDEITSEAGYAGYCTLEGSIVHDFYQNTSSQNNFPVGLQTPFVWQVQYNSSITKTGSHPGGYDFYYTNFQEQIVSTTAPLDVKDVRNFDLQDKLIIVKAEYLNNIYLALCEVNSLISTQTNLYHNRIGQRITGLNCNIISVKEIKSFFTTQNFLFTVDGCAIFQFLDPYKTNLITVENDSTDPDIYLAATMVTSSPPFNKPTVTEKDTQALLFKLTPTGFSFVAVVGGNISDFSQEKSPDAAYWIKYWDRPPASFW